MSCETIMRPQRPPASIIVGTTASPLSHSPFPSLYTVNTVPSHSLLFKTMPLYSFGPPPPPTPLSTQSQPFLLFSFLFQIFHCVLSFLFLISLFKSFIFFTLSLSSTNNVTTKAWPRILQVPYHSSSSI
jgi:hypothetical protein